jgi:AcrR family transcriptional regulator
VADTDQAADPPVTGGGADPDTNQDADPPASRADQRRRTEARILDAAARLFVADGYERTTIRGIAQAAGVDGGLVMHYFGSKQQLFERITHGSPAQPPTGTPEQICEQLLAQIGNSLTHQPVHSLALLRSMLTHPEAAQAARDGAARYQEQLSQALPGADARLRAELVTAVVVGVVVSRHLLKTGEMADADPERITGLLRPCLRSLLGADRGGS